VIAFLPGCLFACLPACLPACLSPWHMKACHASHLSITLSKTRISAKIFFGALVPAVFLLWLP
jgi:hypothetical protein